MWSLSHASTEQRTAPGSLVARWGWPLPVPSPMRQLPHAQPGPHGLGAQPALSKPPARQLMSSSHPLWPTCHLKQGPWVGTRLGTGEHLPPWPPPRPVGLVDAWPMFVVEGTVTRSSHQPSKCGVATFRQALPQSAFLGPSKCLGLLRPPQRRPLCALGKVAVPLLRPGGFRADRRQIAPLRAPGM